MSDRILDFEKAGRDSTKGDREGKKGQVREYQTSLEAQAQAAVAEVRCQRGMASIHATQAATCAGDTMTAEEKQSCFSWATKAEDALASHPLSEEG